MVMLYNFLKWLLPIIFGLIYRWEVTGTEHIPHDGAVIIASNHASNLDPLLLGAALPRKVHFMAKEELFKPPGLGWVCRTLGAFPVRRGSSDRNAIKKAFEILAQGKMLAIFPEGTRSKDGVMKELAPGTMLIAVKSRAVLIPAAIYGSWKLSLKQPFPKISIAFGPAINISDRHTDKEGMLELTQNLSRDIKTLLVKSS